MTSGGDHGTSGDGGSGEARRARLAALLAFAVIGLGFAIVNALSEIDERSRLGQPVDSWQPWVWELSSFAGSLLLAPLVFRASQRLRPPHVPWRVGIPLLALLSLAYSIAHIATMVALRHAIYAALGESYDPGGPGEVFVYEFRKDLLTYAALLLLPHLASRLLDRAGPGRTPDFRLEVRDGSRTVWLSPADIDWVQAAGNYVELHGGFGNLLHRRTLAALERELAPYGFVRIHRSRIVRSDAVDRVETKPSGDFDATMSSGEEIGGSRRFRANLA